MERDIGKLKKNDFTDIVIRIDDFGGKPGVTIREFVTGERYTGFTKSGVKISAADFPKFKEMINSVKESELKSDTESTTSESKPQQKNQKTLEANDEENSDEMPDY